MNAADDQFDERVAARARERFNAGTAAMLAEAGGASEDDDAVVAAVLQRARAEREGEAAEAEASAPEAATRVDGEPAPAANSRTWTYVVIGAAAAMLLAWAWLRAGRSAELPAFEERAFEGGVRTVRGDGPAEAVFYPDTRLRWAIAPTDSVGPEIDVRVHAVGPGNLCLALDRGKRIANSGAIEIAGPLGEIMPLSPGDWSLTVLVAPLQTMESLDNPCAQDESGGYLADVSSVVTRALSVRSSP